MATGLPVSRLINVSVNLSPLAAQFANFNALLIVGDTDVIDVNQRIRAYDDLASVVADFGTSAPEYAAAVLFFAQNPRPTNLLIGRWAQSATAGLLNGGVLTSAEQALANWTAITDGAFKVTVDGTQKSMTGLDFHLVTNLNGVASAITTALAGAATCTWDGAKFSIKSATTGASSTVTYAIAGTAGHTNIASLLKLTSTQASPPVAGIVAETAATCVAILDNLATSWYGIMFASTNIVDADHLAIAAYIQAAGVSHIYGVSSTNTQLLDSTVTTDIASELKAGLYTRTFTQYSAIPYVVASFFGRAFTVNFAANNSVITLMYKQEPGVVPESLTSQQANALIAKRCNFFVNYNNDTAILQNGVMSGPAFFDEIHGTDWLQNQIQTNVWNLLYTSPTKVPQTDPGTHLIVTTVEASCAAAVNNGLVAPGVWNSAGFGTLNQGDLLPKGYYVYAPPVASQAQADREARKSVPIQVACKLAGAIHSVDVIVNVNR